MNAGQGEGKEQRRKKESKVGRTRVRQGWGWIGKTGGERKVQNGPRRKEEGKGGETEEETLISFINSPHDDTIRWIGWKYRYAMIDQPEPARLTGLVEELLGFHHSLPRLPIEVVLAILQ